MKCSFLHVTGPYVDDVPRKEPTSKYLRGLEGVISRLIDSSNLPEEITRTDVQQALFKGNSYNNEEMDVAVHIVNSLRPFAPRMKESGAVPHHVLVTGPFAYFANHLLMAMGFKDFTRRLSPVSSAGKVHAIPLNAQGICETLCPPKEYHFDVFDSTGKLVSQQQSASKNAATMFGAFFDLTVIHTKCTDYGLRFANRLVL